MYESVFVQGVFNTHTLTHMGQVFSVTSNSTRVAQLERDLASEKGKCFKNDVIITDLQREVQDLKKQTEELDEVQEIAKALELENESLEAQVTRLTTTDGDAKKIRQKLEACTTRAQELKNENNTLRRKLETSNEKTASRRDVPNRSPTITGLQLRVRTLEQRLIEQRKELIRITRFSARNFTSATYKRTWAVRKATWIKSRVQGELQLINPNSPPVSYSAVFSIREGVLTIAAVPIGVRRVLQADAIWNDLLEMAGRRGPEPAVVVGNPKPSVVIPTPATPPAPVKPVVVKPIPRTQTIPAFLRPFMRPWRVRTTVKNPDTARVAVARPYRRNNNMPTSTIAASYRR